MNKHFQPTYANGKICYLEIPALDIQQSSTFYQNVFDWKIRKDNGGNITFDDTVGQVSGMWVLDRKANANPGVLVSIMVFDMQKTLSLIIQNKGIVIKSPDNNASEIIAHFSDPASNIFSLYQHRQRAI